MEEVRIPVGERHAVSGLFERPAFAEALFVLAHGAGAGMRHPFLEDFAAALARRGVATLRYQFPYMEAGGGPRTRRGCSRPRSAPPSPRGARGRKACRSSRGANRWGGA